MLAPGPFGRKQPTKIGGIAYIIVGFMGLFIAGFVFVLSSRFGDNQQFWQIFGGVIVLYALFRIFTGIRTLKKASELKEDASLGGKHVPASMTKAKEQ